MAVGPGIALTVPWNGPFMIVAASTDGIDYDRNANWTATPGEPGHPPLPVLRLQGRR